MPLTVVVIGCEHSQGLSKKDDRPYNFAQVNYLASNEGWKSEKGECKPVGLVQKQIAMNPNPSLVAAFKELETQFPMTCELHLDADPQNPARNIVVDIKPVSGKA
ncbi:hypothetical protein [Vibrio coralliilyticus]|uniref:hypothetical protein n=1 Tax=Vibrio coralliilyticus TaxID=190893 RepID=UPI000BAADBE2|nr:hypothetical protein [Vibrio coralliilyticus]NOI60645.1 hypothetical protein [Vibrio coralliilyticus]PAT65383.1 hypothetical protein CKA27_25015 [Vibrio coralliilyticus]